MNKLLSGSLLLFCIAGTWTLGCSSSKAPATSNSTSGGSTSVGGNSTSGGSESSVGGNTTSGGDTSTEVDTTPHDTTLRTVTPDDTAHLLYSGRMDFTDPTRPVYAAPGASVTAKFTGVSISVMFQDAMRGQNYYDVIVDGTQTFLIQPLSGKTKYDVVPNAAQNIPPLDYKEHTVVFVKRTETSQGSVTFLGFEFGGPPSPAPARPTRKLEIIGDSITAGSGVEPGLNQVNCNTASGNAAQNAYLTYGAELARNLNAEWYITAAGGRGVFENYECGSADTLPAGYDHMNQRDLTSPLWDHTKYVPDAIIIDLGTNDFSPDNCDKPPISPACDPVKYQSLISAFEAFVTKLRGYYGSAHIFLTSSPMLTDDWPGPAVVGDAGSPCPYTSRTSQISAITSVVKYFNDAGDAKVHLVDTIPKGRGFGCGTHPNVSEQLEIGGTPDSYNASPTNMLLTPVKTAMGW